MAKQDWEPAITDEADLPTEGDVAAYRVGIFPAIRAFVSPQPVETQDFIKAAEGIPQLRDELARLMKAYPSDALAALANALIASVQGRRRGPAAFDVPLEAEAKARQWGARIGMAAAKDPGGRRSRAVRAMMNNAITEVAALLPSGASAEARRERAKRLIARFAQKPPTARVSRDLARARLRAMKATAEAKGT